jgi:DNA-binding transcriptional ArsR family regulator
MDRNVSADPDLPALAAAVAAPSRAAMLQALMGGIALPASELAWRAGVAAATASEHLARLESAGLVRARAQGRHRYYELADARVARAVELLSTLAPPCAAPAPRGCGEALRKARFCYDHLAGTLGVALADALLRSGAIKEDGDDFIVTPSGAKRFAALGLDLDSARARRRHFARRCLDWSERRPHVAGALGTALAELMEEKGWVTRSKDDRSARVTPKGLRALQEEFGVLLEGDEFRAPAKKAAR